MIKTSRQIKTEEDRFGGYIPRTESSRRNVEVDLDVDPDKELSFSRRTFVEPSYEKDKPAAPEKEESIYSTLDKPRRTVTPPARKPSAVRRDAEDVMPSIRTHDATERHEETESDRNAGLLGTRTKVMLAIYVAVAVILAAIVIATGIALSSSTASVASLEAQVAARNATIAEQTSQILALEDDTLLSGMAVEQGMSPVSSVTEFELLPVEDAPAVTESTNWFDRFCDWLSKIL